MALAPVSVSKAKPRNKQYKLTDERGLYLLVTPSGGRYWRLQYRFEGKWKALALGVYPDVSLAKARERRDRARELQFIFPGFQSLKRPMSENALNGALRRLGYSGDEMTSHGFRAMASTLLNEMGRWHPDAIERQLAHVEANEVQRAYSRGEYWEERVQMMQEWSDYLDRLRDGASS